MRPLYLTISGWGPYKDLVEINFEKIQQTGLFLITGPTGAGKTTIFDAISYALYGNLSGDMREKGTVRSDFASGDVQTFVKLIMEHGGQIYEIYRNPEYLRPKKRRSGEAELTKEKENAILTYQDGKVLEGIKEVNAKLLEILVLDYNQFKQISMLAQGQFSKLLNASSKEKVAIFREIFGTHIFDRFTSILKSKVRALEEKDKALKNKLEEALQILGDRPGVAEFEEGLAFLEWLGKDNIHYQSVLDVLNKWQKDIASQKKDMEITYEQLDKRFQELAARESAVKELNRKFDQLAQVRANIEALQAQEAQVKSWQQALVLAMAASEVKVFEQASVEANTQYDKTVRQEAALKEEYTELLKEQQGLTVFGQFGVQMEELLQLRDKLVETERALEENTSKMAQKAAQLERAREVYLQLEQDRDLAKEAFELADKAYKRGMVGIVATTMLKQSEPCPVCGSIEHPMPATLAKEVPTEQELDQLNETFVKKEEVLQESHRALLENQMNQESLQKEVFHLQEAKKTQQEEMVTREAFLEENEISIEGLTMSILRTKQQRFAQMAGLLEGKVAEMKRLRESVLEAEKEKDSKAEALKMALREKGFQNQDAYRDSLLTREKQSEIQARIARHQQDMAAAIQLKDHLEAELEGKERQEETTLSEQTALAKTQRENLRQQMQQLGSLSDAVKETKDAIKDKMEILVQVETEYGYVKDLESLASGRNSANLVFEQYVLAGYFDEILRAANLRFSKMTGGRYEMARMEEVGDARRKDSLEIEVMDYYTGKARPIKTLSGGESFKASLSLALGLSDVIQAMSGGIKVDVLFVDEGFGALDGESLDQACETMQSLVGHNRMIGIISHVQELRERISNQIVVERSSGGSTVKIVN